MKDRRDLFAAPSPKRGAQSTQVHLFESPNSSQLLAEHENDIKSNQDSGSKIKPTNLKIQAFLSPYSQKLLSPEVVTSTMFVPALPAVLSSFQNPNLQTSTDTQSVDSKP
jgi:hypothetical protein